MKKRGFTLVELLGIIILLGVIATLILYSVNSIITDAERDAAIQSADQLVKAIVLDYTEKDSFTTDELDVLSFDYDGKKPDYGYIQFNENEQSRLYMVYNGYCVTKKYDGSIDAKKMTDNITCTWTSE